MTHTDRFEDRLAALSPAKRALLELRLKQGRAQSSVGVGGFPPIGRRVVGDSTPLSFAQQRLWFLEQLAPGSPLYNVPCRAWLTGHLNVDALRRALEELVARHEALRTRIGTVEGNPVQVVMPPYAIDLPVTDLTALSKVDQKVTVRRLGTEEARRVFDLARGPLLRAGLLRLSEVEHALLLTLHHIVSDGWSIGVLFRELGVLYDAYARGEPSPLPELPIQYADYAVAQREWLQGPVLERELAYWKRQFATLPPTLELPTDRPRPAGGTHRGARIPFTVPATLTQQLHAVGAREGATLYMTLLAAFKVLIARHTGQDDIVVGSPIAGRTRPETEGLIGFFVNSLPLRTDVSGDPAFLQLLARVREGALGAYAHQELPFEKLVEELGPQRDLTHAPLFRVMFVLQSTPRSQRRLPGLRLRQIEIDKGMAKFDLTMKLAEDASGLRGVISYDADLFDAATVEAMARHYQVLLESIAADPSRRVSQLPLVTAGERELVVVEWNQTARDYPRNRCVHQLVEDQAARRPNAPAVILGDRQLTYGALNTRANQLARRLRQCGVGPDLRVGLYADRSLELMIGLLAILKAGGAYVPLDPSYPDERLRQMLADAGARVLLADPALLKRELGCKPPEGITVVPLGPAASPLDDQGGGNLSVGASALNLAYVMYTSGSTGTPKGVAVPHRALINFSLAAAREYRMTGADRVLQFSSIGSDLSADEIFPAWASGAALVLRAPGPPPVGAELVDTIRRGGVTVLSLPTAYWHGWVEELSFAPRQLPPTLRLVIVGGERARAVALDRWRRVASGQLRWLNTYGPTEATVEATIYEPVAADPVLDGREVPIGHPIANTRVYVLDQRMQPVPIGAPGELYLGGEGVARGYIGRPGVTAERFLPDPFGADPGGRLYRTGDRVRFATDGNLVFLGRLDDQIKIRGFRIEPGEVEAVLAGHPAVRACAVGACQASTGDSRLVAYVVVAQEPPPDAGALRRFLAARLPEPMLPTEFMFLEALPVLANGKLNRRALPAGSGSRPGPEAGHVPPRTRIEEQIAAIWRAVLGLERVGAHDNFFELGGHSLLATQVIARLRAELEIELPLRSLFEAPTVAGLAEQVEAIHRLLEEITGLGASEVRAQLSPPEPSLLRESQRRRKVGEGSKE